MNQLAETGAALLGGKLDRIEGTAGGDLSLLVRIVLADGRRAIVKEGPTAPAEAEMLRTMAETGAPVPRVLAVDDDAFVMEILPHGGSASRAWASLGAAVRRLHGARGERYGWHRDHAFGPVGIANGWSDDWPDFWAERRLLVHLPHLDADLAGRIDDLARRLPDLLPARPAPVLLHGDLWVGNVLAEGSEVTGLIDPACYYGHAEVDLAMLSLFGSPGPAFYEAYGPLEPGRDARLPLYQLWPALVHVRLFGAGYRGMVERLLVAVGA